MSNSEAPPSDLAEPEIGATLRRGYYLLRERVWLIATCVCLALILDALYVARTPNSYDATTTIQVNQAARNVMQIQDVQTQDLTTLELLNTIQQNLSNLTVMRRVVARLHLTPDMLDLGGPIKDVTFIVHKLTNPIVQWLHPRNPVQADSDAINDTALILRDDVKVSLQRSTRLISVTAENRDPKLTQNIAEAVVAEYMMQRLKEQSGHSSTAVQVLSKQAAEAQAKLRQSEQAVHNYEEEHQAVSLKDTQNIIVQKLKELNAKVTEAKTERLRLEADYAQVQRIGLNHPENLLNLASVAKAPDVLEQKKKVAEQEAEVANLSKRYGPLHPKLIQTKSQLAELQAGLNRTIATVAAGLGIAYESALHTEQKFERALADQEQEALALNKIAIPYNVLQREVDSDTALYDLLLKQMKQTDALTNIGDEEIRVVDPAFVPESPARPRVLLMTMLSALGGVCAGIGISLVLSLLEGSFKTVDEAEAGLELPLVGAIPHAMRAERRCRQPVIASSPASDIAESFRTLRTELSLVVGQPRSQTIVFVSAAPGEGKTFCALNYAASLAQQGRRVLLMDADLRVPAVGSVLGFRPETPGIVDCVAGGASLHDVVRKTSVDNLFVLPAGSRVRNPIDILADPRFARLIKEAKDAFDCIVLDSAPIHAVSDTLLVIKNVVSFVCLVVRAGTTPRKAVLRALHKLTVLNSRPIGFVLNGLPRWGRYYYRYGGQKYGLAVHSPENGAVASVHRRG